MKYFLVISWVLLYSNIFNFNQILSSLILLLPVVSPRNFEIRSFALKGKHLGAIEECAVAGVGEDVKTDEG